MPTPTDADHHEPSPEVLRAYIRCWETRDLDGLLALMRDDVVFTMPPWAVWFRGRVAVRRFLTGAGFTAFWTSGVRVRMTRANGRTALVFYRDGGRTPHSMQLLHYDGAAFAEGCNFVGPAYLRPFQLSATATEHFGDLPVS